MRTFVYRGYTVHFFRGWGMVATWITSPYDNSDVFSDDDHILPDEDCKKIIDSWFESIEQLRLF